MDTRRKTSGGTVTSLAAWRERSLNPVAASGVNLAYAATISTDAERQGEIDMSSSNGKDSGAPSDDLPCGTELVPTKYVLDEPLGRGGMSTVYRARETSLNMEYAIKRLRRERAQDEQEKKRFEQEGKMLAALRHDHIVRVHSLFEIEFGIFLVMDLIDGEPLDQLVARYDPCEFPHEDTRVIMDQVLSAIAYCHKQGVIHRDLKPDNVLVGKASDGSYSVKVTDFGIARSSKLNANLTNYLANPVFGTPVYIPPEIWAGRVATQQSDIYSLAILLYFLLTTSVPFPVPCGADIGNQQRALECLIREAPPPDVRSRRPDISESLRQAVMKGLAKDPKDRFESVEQMREAINRAFTEMGIAPAFRLSLPDQVSVSINGARMGDSMSETLCAPALATLAGNRAPQRKRWFAPLIGAGAVAAAVIGYVFVIAPKMSDVSAQGIVQAVSSPISSPVQSAPEPSRISVEPPASEPSALAPEPELTATQTAQMDGCLKGPFKWNPACGKFCKACETMPSRHVFCRSSCKFAGLEK